MCNNFVVNRQRESERGRGHMPTINACLSIHTLQPFAKLFFVAVVGDRVSFLESQSSKEEKDPGPVS